jgi:hypothetical protein
MTQPDGRLRHRNSDGGGFPRTLSIDTSTTAHRLSTRLE